MGPVLFTIYMNDISSEASNSKTHMYADDTIIYSCAPNFLKQPITYRHLSFFAVFHFLELVLNSGETKVLHFSRSGSKFAVNIHTADGQRIKQVFYYNYLGVWLDENLTFKADNLVKRFKVRPKTKPIMFQFLCVEKK